MDRRVSGWARPFVDDEYEGPIVLPQRAAAGRNWLRQRVDQWHEELRIARKRHKKVALRLVVSAVLLFVLSRMTMLPVAIQWTAFFGSVITGALSIFAFERAAMCRVGLGLEPELLPEDE